MEVNNIRALRTKTIMSQTELSEKIGVSQQAVANWESGKASPRADKLPKLAEVLGCKIEDLFEQKENTAPAV